MRCMVCAVSFSLRLVLPIPTCRQRRTEDDQMSRGARCCFGLLFLTTQVLLHGLITLILYWVIQFRWKDGQGLPFAWRGTGRVALEKQWNLHPVLMVTGFIYCMGQGIPTPSMSSSIYQTSFNYFSHARLPVMSLLSPHLQQALAHILPHPGHPLRGAGVPCSLGLPLSEDRQGWEC